MSRTAPAWPLPAGAIVALVAVVAAPVAAQPPTSQPPTVMYYGLLYLNMSEPLRQELKLTDEQVQKLAGHRGLTGQVGRAGTDDKARAELLKEIEKAVNDSLKPDQVKRLKQIVLQQLEGRSSGRGTVLGRMPEVADELKLTAEQKAKVTAGATFADVLTDAQKAAWKTMTGDKLDIVIVQGGFGGPTSPPNLQYLAETSVQAELKLTDDQKARIADLQKPWQSLGRTRSGTAEERKKIEELARSTDEAVAKMLDPSQGKRLKQVMLQRNTDGGREVTVFTRREVITELKLTDVQQAAIKAAIAEGRKAMVPLFLTGEPADEIDKKVVAHKAATYDRLAQVLDARQRDSLKDVIGEPFKGEIRSAGLFGGGFSGPPPFLMTPQAVSVSGLSLANSKPLHDELKLTEVQVRRLTELRDKSLAQTRQQSTRAAPGSDEADKALRQKAAENDKALADILEPQQRARFQQIVLQYYMTANGPFPGQVTRFIEVADGLKLTKEQKERLVSGEEMLKVFDDTQKARWTEMRGEPFAGVASLRPPVGGGRGTLTNKHLLYLNEKSVRDELKLTEEQIAKLPGLATKWDDLTKDRNDWRRGQDYTKKLAEVREALDQAIATVLDAGQMARFRQIDMQQTRKSGLGALLAPAKVQTELGLTDEQVGKVKAINEDANKTQNLISRELLRFTERRVEEDYTKTQEAFTKVTDTKLMTVLTPLQKEKLVTLLGPPFTGEIRNRGGFGGIGGFLPG